MNYQLEKYRNPGSRHECPRCGDKHSFTYYVDEAGNVLDKSVGRCNHESSCGYHYTPKQYFTDHPDGRECISMDRYTPTPPKSIKPLCTIPFSYVERSASYNSAFVYFLCGLFDKRHNETGNIERLMSDYAIGATKDQSVIYWQIDIQGRVRTGKIMKYDPNTGHRIKDSGGVNWVHSLMKRQGALPESWELTQCLFGEHLLGIKENRGKTVALVESEKSALIGSYAYPDYIWLATGGKSQLSTDKLRVLKGRTVIMFPDVDGFKEWNEKAKEIVFAKVVVSDLLEKCASDADRAAKIDIADWIIRELSKDRKQVVKELLSKAERAFISMQETCPAFKKFVKDFDCVLC